MNTDTPRPTVVRIVLRSLVAAVGMLACAFAPVLPFLHPGYAAWMSVERDGAEGTLQLVAEIARFGIAVVAASVLLLLAARVERVRLRDYLGRVPAGRAWGVLLATSVAAAAVTGLGAGLATLTGLDAGRGAVPETAGIPLLLVVAYGLARAYLLQGIQEEWWFRGFAFRGGESRPWLVLVVTTVVFTLMHLTASGGQQSPAERVLYLVLPLGMGLWAGAERWCTGTVWGAVGIHGGIHTGLIAPTLLGWPLGPAAWVIIGLVLCVAAAGRLVVTKPWARRGAGAVQGDVPVRPEL